MAALKCKVGWPAEYAGHCTMVMSHQENASSSNNSNKIMDRDEIHSDKPAHQLQQLHKQ